MKIELEHSVHQNLRGGEGQVIISLLKMKRWFFKKKPPSELSRIALNSHSSIGWHGHPYRMIEIYLTLDKNVRFNDKNHWTPINVCFIDKQHSVKNISSGYAYVYACKI